MVQVSPLRPRFIRNSIEDPFLKKIQTSGKKWVILTDETGEPRLSLNSDAFLRSMLFDEMGFNPQKFCHRPIIIKDSKTTLGEAMTRLKVFSERLGDDVIDEDTIVFWSMKNGLSPDQIF
jgi:hypothetical protein